MTRIVKYCACILGVIALLCMMSCSHKDENDEIMNFYLSQPRDPELVGWWEYEYTDGDGITTTLYHYFNENGTVVMNMEYRNGALDRGTGVWYWYATDNVYHTFDRHDSWLKGRSPQSETRYEVRGDELWIDSSPDFVLFGKRTKPQL